MKWDDKDFQEELLYFDDEKKHHQEEKEYMTGNEWKPVGEEEIEEVLFIDEEDKLEPFEESSEWEPIDVEELIEE